MANDNTSPNPNIQDLFSTLMGGLVGLQPSDINNIRNDHSSCDFINWKDPPFDMVESEDNISIYIFVPAVQRSSISVDIYGNRLILSGTRERPFSNPLTHDTGIKTYHKCGNVYGDFKKDILLPTSVLNKEKVHVSCKNGLLIIKIDKESSSKFNITLDDEVD